MTKIVLDSHQKKVQTVLDELAKQLDKRASQRRFTRKAKINSLYVYGDVGRGKSMLMKRFYGSIIKTPKLEFHFNSFMRQIHEALRDIRNEPKKYKDELIEATKRVTKIPAELPKRKRAIQAKLICLDEFQVTDIADAMLLSRIFSYLFAKKITVIFTSNSRPTDLYKNGLQRELFLEFVNATLLKNCQVHNLNSPTDYRVKYTKNLAQRYFIAGAENNQKIKDIIDKLTNSKPLSPSEITVWGRQIVIKKTYKEKIAVIHFNDLCQTDHSASDFQGICQRFSLIFLMNLPKLSGEDVNEMKRFMLFIDEIYENKTALIVKAKVDIDNIYSGTIGAEAFKRTLSRLKEIKSDSYWKASKINILN